jgi:hypothetical protein
MSSRKLRRALSPVFIALGACSPMPMPTSDGGQDAGTDAGSDAGNGTCTVVRVPDAGVVTYACAEGGTCTAPNPAGMDGGTPYQLCPGPNECETIVAYDGSSMIGLC